MKLKWVGLAGIVVIAAGAGGAGLLAGRQAVQPPLATTTTTTTAPAGETDSDLVEFRHEEAGFALSYPKEWTRLESADPQVVLIVAEGDPAQHQGGSLLVRVTNLGVPVDREHLGELRQVTDALVTSAEDVQLRAEPALIEQGGLPGYFYLYTFEDPESGQRGVHSHYFLFREQNMVTLVFQALPEDDFSRLAALFDRVANSFRVL